MIEGIHTGDCGINSPNNKCTCGSFASPVPASSGCCDCAEFGYIAKATGITCNCPCHASTTDWRDELKAVKDAYAEGRAAALAEVAALVEELIEKHQFRNQTGSLLIYPAPFKQELLASLQDKK